MSDIFNSVGKGCLRKLIVLVYRGTYKDQNKARPLIHTLLKTKFQMDSCYESKKKILIKIWVSVFPLIPAPWLSHKAEGSGVGTQQ